MKTRSEPTTGQLAVGRVPPGRLAAKRRLHQRLTLLRPRIATAVGQTPQGVTPHVVHVGVSDAGHAPLGAGLEAELTAFCEDAATAAAIREQAPDYDVRAAPSGYAALDLESETADVVVTTELLAGRAHPGRRRILEELFRVLRVGGPALLLETFVDHPDGGEPDHQRLGEFLEMVVLASGGRVFVDRLRSVRFPGEHVRRGGLVTLVKTGAPQRW